MRLNRRHGTQVDPSGSRGPFDRPDNPEGSVIAAQKDAAW